MAYDSDSIKVLSDIEHIRLRLGMYIGEPDNPHHLLTEVLDNAIDEAQSGYSNKTVISVDTSIPEYCVTDYGRGIPHGKKNLEDGSEVEIVELLCTKANSGGKFESKSYAYSCFTGDTKIRLADNRDISISDLLEEFKSGKTNYVYSIDNETKEVRIEKISNVTIAKTVTKLSKVTLDTGEVIFCTPDHRFIARDYTLVEASSLEIGQSLLPGYFRLSTEKDRKAVVGYNMIFDHSLNRYVMCHDLADRHNLRYGLYEKTESELISDKKFVRHHRDFHKLNNNPSNLERCTWNEHKKKHPGVTAMMRISGYSEEEISQVYSKARRAWWNSLSEEDKEKKRQVFRHNVTSAEGYLEAIRESGRRSLTRYNKSEKGRETSKKAGRTLGVKNLLNYVYSEANRVDKSARMKRMNTDYEMGKKQRAWQHTPKGISDMQERMTQRNSDKTYQEYTQLCRCLKFLKEMREAGIEISEESYVRYRRNFGRKYNTLRSFAWIISKFENYSKLIEAVDSYNHTVVSSEVITVEPTLVYDITINERASNFLLSAGVFVKNSGLHGIGLTLVNALSSSLYVSSVREGQKVELYANDSEVTSLLYTEVPKEWESSTVVSFSPDPKYFASREIPLEFIKERCRVLNAFGYPTELIVDQQEVSDIGSGDIFSLLPECEKSYCKARFDRDIDGERIIVLLNYTNGTKYTCAGYTNLVYNKVGGTHVRLLRKAVCEAWQTLYRTFKNESDIELCYEDCLVGLDSLVAVFLKEISFSSQTKEKLTVPADSLAGLMASVKEDIVAYFSENETLRKSLVKRFEEYRIAQNRLLSQKEITSLIRVNESKDGTVKRRSVVPGLIECTSSQVEGSELYLVEGKCLAGSTKVLLANGIPMSLDDIDRSLKSCSVLSYDTERKEFTETDCTSVGIACYSKHNKRIYLWDAETNTELDGYIECTPEHRFLVGRDSIEWATAGELKEMDQFLCYPDKDTQEHRESCLRCYGLDPSWRYFVSRIEDIDYETPVPMYCLNVPKTSNFILEYGGIVSHNSAAGPIARARNPKLQAVLPLRGKIKNVTGMTIKEALKSQEVCSIVNAIGCGVGEKADPKNSRYGKIIIQTDADVDGLHIASLILACLVTIVPAVVKAGMVYILEPPLYGYTPKNSKKRMYASSLDEIPKDATNLTRYKGLGEMDDEEFRDSCLFEGRRRLYRVAYPDDLDSFNRIMGTSEGRSSLLSELGIIRQAGDSETEA